ncbi:hypothetical protein J5X84_28250 [Streptosporangiaceae bacterium NEAU-GS5]|nr:hypothetical protein [Streptosporangiaceae bacterium NEAU-GS5]
MDEINVFGLLIPNAGPLFFAALVAHVIAGMTCVACGAVAGFSRKGSGRHLRFGRIYLWGLIVVFTTMTIMAAIRWRENAHLFAVGSVALVTGLLGYANRRRSQIVHLSGMGASYVALLTGFYVDNGPHLPVWNLLPNWAFWTLPSMVGLPIILRAISHRRAAALRARH